MVELELIDINALFAVILNHTLNMLRNGEFDVLVGDVTRPLTVVAIIFKGLELYYHEEDVRKLLFFSVVRIGGVWYILLNYEALFYDYLWQGLYNEVALRLGTLELLNLAFGLVLIALGALVIAGGLAVFTGGMSALLGTGLFLVVLLSYAGMLFGGIHAVLVASIHLILGKFFVWSLLFEKLEGWFWGWLKSYIGALMGLAVWYFVLGALYQFGYWDRLEEPLTNITDLAQVASHLANMALLFIVTALASATASSTGRQVMGG